LTISFALLLELRCSALWKRFLHNNIRINTGSRRINIGGIYISQKNPSHLYLCLAPQW